LYTGAFPRRRGFVFSARVIEYTALSTGCSARLALLMTFGVTARLTARPGCIARRIPRGTNKRDRNPTGIAFFCLSGVVTVAPATA
jgi:hypothetical protein